ncbi:MAG: heavy-metal-associated domain-containing protein [Acidimicrobiales bacterium]|nr:heavy-metal-associated domain-containing protein [Acidimicrobiales bacterium]
MNAQTRTYSVPAMSCDHCIKAITGSVTPVPGVESVVIDLKSKVVTVVGGDDAAIIAAIDDAGYDIA